MPFALDTVEQEQLDRLWPVRFNGTRHSDDCYWTMVDWLKHHEIYLRPICKCGLDVWLRMKQIPTLTGKRAKEFGWM